MKKLLIFLGVFLGAPGVIALALHYKWFALIIAILGLAGLWSVLSYVFADRWDRLLGICYGKCREEKP